MGLECRSEIILLAKFSQGKILDLTGHSKQKDKPEKESKKESKSKSKKHSSASGSSSSGATGGGGVDDMDSSEADLVTILANQVVKEESKKLRPGFRAKKKGTKTVIKKKISEWEFNVYVGAFFFTCSEAAYTVAK